MYLTLHNTGKCCDFVQFRELIVVARSTNCILQETDNIAVFSGIIDAVFDEFNHRSDYEKKAHRVEYPGPKHSIGYYRILFIPIGSGRNESESSLSESDRNVGLC